MMTVKELTEMLSEMPEDATVHFRDDLCGHDHYAESIELKDGEVWIRELPESYY